MALAQGLAQAEQFSGEKAPQKCNAVALQHDQDRFLKAPQQKVDA